MPPVSKATPPPAMTLADVSFVLFRHKWKILICLALGTIAALYCFFTATSLYQSEAKLFIRYVLESKALAPGNDAGVKSPDRGGESIINSELQILTSLDLAEQVAEAIGPEKVLAKAGGGKDPNLAAALIHKNLLVEAPRQSSVICITFQHPDPTLVQPILTQLVDSYLKKHVEIHRAVGIFDDFLTQQTDQLRSRLAQTEEELRRAKTNLGVFSLEDSRKSYNEEMTRIQQTIFDTQAELAARQAAADELSQLLQARVEPVPSTNKIPVSNATAVAAANAVPLEKVSEYNRVCGLVDSLAKKEQELSLEFTPENSMLRQVREQLRMNEQLKGQMEKATPALLAVKISAPSAMTTAVAGDPTLAARSDLTAALTQIKALQSKIKVLTNQLAEVRSRAAAIDQNEGSITELERKKEREESQYRYYSASLEQARIDEALGATKSANITKIQEPSPPAKSPSKAVKMAALFIPGGALLGIACAFLIEMVLDRSLKRPVEIESKLHLPLLLSIPYRNGYSRRLLSALRSHSSATASPPATEPALSGALVPASPNTTPPWDSRHALRPFYEALRDRVMVQFEVRNLTHKPKLVAVTGCSAGAGVSSIASGLAACLSETGDGNVLLVDMNLKQGAAHPFYHGKPVCALDDALEVERRDNALVQDNLYLVAEASSEDKLPRALPKRFSHLIPKLKASDYDYIIFDMPPIDQLSITPRLAGLMDIVLFVVESEKTSGGLAKRASRLLEESKAHAHVVLNKTHNYMPGWLPHEG